jgi:hypothetical protein
MTVKRGRHRRRNALLGALVLFGALFVALGSTAQASHYSISLTFEFHNGFPHNTEVKVVRKSSSCVAVHPDNPKEVGKHHRINLGSADVDTGGDCFWSQSTANLKLENARTGNVLAYLEVYQTGPRLFAVDCKPGQHPDPKVSRCSGGNDPAGPRWFWRIVH